MDGSGGVRGLADRPRQDLSRRQIDRTPVLAVHGNGAPLASVALDSSLLDRTSEQIKSSYERRLGGFRRAPKFPRPVALNFLLRYYARTGTPYALEMPLFTLRKMADGGIYDHIGGGLHR
jgi:uncharacterized protein YyaL (SSP411 family)